MCFLFPLHPLAKKSTTKLTRHFTDGDCITRQGAAGDSLYIISKGQVKVTEKKPGRDEPRPLSEGQWFGERALWEDYIQTENVIAVGDVTCLVIKIGESYEITREFKSTGSHKSYKLTPGFSMNRSDMDVVSLSSSTLSDFQIICGLAVGEFGHVDLVQLKTNIQRLFAMKVLTKRSIVKSAQREHLIREGRILKEIRCAFIVRLYKMFKDAECLYSLTEACLGGDLSDLLRYKGYLDECSTRFYTACVVEALTFLHCRGVVYRDVKPENVVLDEHGYAKLVLTCVKNVEAGQRTWTFCGTLGYMSPEVILCKGHSTSSDMWSLGVLVFELLSGRLPFSSSDPEKILTSTIGGIDESDFPKTISKRASSLITELCRSNPAERLGSRRNGAKEIQKHKWFEGFNWHGLCKRTMAPPLIPKVRRHTFDLMYFTITFRQMCCRSEVFLS
uniref:cGMP-dependent protein kinase n=1 Tax=Gouania willdenowi TaxID=441366 RepID=A0A8C5HDT6_GOUWI